VQNIQYSFDGGFLRYTSGQTDRQTDIRGTVITLLRTPTEAEVKALKIYCERYRKEENA